MDRRIEIGVDESGVAVAIGHAALSDKHAKGLRSVLQKAGIAESDGHTLLLVESAPTVMAVHVENASSTARKVFDCVARNRFAIRGGNFMGEIDGASFSVGLVAQLAMVSLTTVVALAATAKIASLEATVIAGQASSAAIQSKTERSKHVHDKATREPRSLLNPAVKATGRPGGGIKFK